MAFKRNDQCYGHVHGIVFLNGSILCKNGRFSMAHNVAPGSFQLYFTLQKIHFSFSECYKGVFCEASTENMMENGTTIFL